MSNFVSKVYNLGEIFKTQCEKSNSKLIKKNVKPLIREQVEYSARVKNIIRKVKN